MQATPVQLPGKHLRICTRECPSRAHQRCARVIAGNPKRKECIHACHGQQAPFRTIHLLEAPAEPCGSPLRAQLTAALTDPIEDWSTGSLRLLPAVPILPERPATAMPSLGAASDGDAVVKRPSTAEASLRGCKQDDSLPSVERGVSLDLAAGDEDDDDERDDDVPDLLSPTSPSASFLSLKMPSFAGAPDSFGESRSKSERKSTKWACLGTSGPALHAGPFKARFELTVAKEEPNSPAERPRPRLSTQLSMRSGASLGALGRRKSSTRSSLLASTPQLGRRSSTRRSLRSSSIRTSGRTNLADLPLQEQKPLWWNPQNGAIEAMVHFEMQNRQQRALTRQQFQQVQDSEKQRGGEGERCARLSINATNCAIPRGLARLHDSN